MIPLDHRMAPASAGRKACATHNHPQNRPQKPCEHASLGWRRARAGGRTDYRRQTPSAGAPLKRPRPRLPRNGHPHCLRLSPGWDNAAAETSSPRRKTRCPASSLSPAGHAPGSPSPSTSKSFATGSGCIPPWRTGPRSKPLTAARQQQLRDQHPEELSKILDTAHLSRPQPVAGPSPDTAVDTCAYTRVLRLWDHVQRLAVAADSQLRIALGRDGSARVHRDGAGW